MESEGTPDEKFVIMIYYTGHGTIAHGTQRVSLEDEKEYPLEAKIRNFKNDNA